MEGEIVMAPQGNPASLEAVAGVMSSSAAGGDVPDQGRFADQSTRQRLQFHPRVAADGADAAIIHAQNQAVPDAYQGAGSRFHSRSAYLLNGHLAVQVLLQKLAGAGQIELEALFDHVCAGGG